MKTILLVDDDTALRTIFCLALRRCGYRVIEAGSGVEGLALARLHLPDLILSDINMPGGDGTSLLLAIRRDPELRSKQVVLMTGRPDLVTPRRAMEEGADDFLIKPVNFEDLRACVEARFSRASISWRVEDQTVAQLRSSVPTQLPHEFFTPLAGIIGLVDILRADADALDPNEVKDIYNDVYRSALRLHRTLRNYLLILELQQASPPAIFPPLSAPQVRESIETGLNETFRQNERRDDLTLDLNDCPLAIRSGDLSLLVEELIDNACKFSRRGTPVHLELTVDGQLTVTDHGRGLTPEEISHIGAFRQFDRKKNEQQGLGLGLVLVQKIAALCAADFSIQSQPGVTTQVRLVFPPPA